MAAVGVTMPALITAPGAPVAEDDEVAEEDDEALLPQAARIDPSSGTEMPTTVAAADEVAPGQPSRGELVDDVIGDVTLALAKAREPAVGQYSVSQGASVLPFLSPGHNPTR